MRPEKWAKIKSVFDSVVLIDVDDRSSYLDKACANDAELRREVESLLSAHAAAGGFLERPLAEEVVRASIAVDRDELKSGAPFGRYKIIRKIGSGGIGKVYLAEDTQLGRLVAIKLLSSAKMFESDHIARFVREARLASLLNHPNVLTIYEIGRADDLHFISTEFIEGETLRTRLSSGPLTAKEAVPIAIDVASALAVAHRAGIVHRDIKPENIMLRSDGLLKVLDFGLAKLGRRDLHGDGEDLGGDVKTAPGMILGTVSYMSPEQTLGQKMDGRTDIWSLGVVLYEMIAGRAPFAGASRVETLDAILNDAPKDIKYPSSHVQRGLRKIIKRALAKDPNDRYQTVEELLVDLRILRTEIESGNTEPCSIAILPFSNMTRNERFAFFEFALADAIITELGRSQSLVVRPSASIAKYLGKELDPIAIGRELNVDAILTANFVVSTTRIRVTAQLIDINKKNVLWSEQIDSDTSDLIGLEDTITFRIAEGLKCELEPPSQPNIATPGTRDSLAYVEYLRGRDQLRRYMFHTVANENVEIAIKHFERAIELDPQFALAFCGLGTCHLQKVMKIVGVQKDLDLAASALDQAIALDPRIIDARAYRSYVTRLQGHIETSRAQMAALRREAPNNFEIQYLSAAAFRLDGEYDKAIRCYAEMLRIDPTAQVAVHYCRARIYSYRREIDRAYRELDLADKIEPNHPIVRFFRAIGAFRSGDPASAVVQMRALFTPSFPCKGFRPFLAICLNSIGRHEEALSELTDEVEEIAAVDPDVSYWVASTYAGAGNMDTAFEWFRRSIKLGKRDRRLLETDALAAPLRRDPRFYDLLQLVN